MGVFTLCVKSSDQVSSLTCPIGYDEIGFKFLRVSNVQSFKMDRQGNVMLDTVRITTLKSIAFNADGAFKVILKEVPDQSTNVRLLNAVRYVPPEPVETTTLKKSGSVAVFSVVVIVLLAISGLLIVGLVVLICYCRRKMPPKMEQSDDQNQKLQTPTSLKNGHSAPPPPKPKSRRTLSTTVTTTTAMTTVKPSSSSHTRPVPSASPFDNNFLNNSTNGSASFKGASGRRLS